MTAGETANKKPRFGILSILLMFVPILTIVVMNVLIYPVFGKLPNAVERFTLIFFALLPVLLGLIFAITGLVKKESRKWIHIIGLIFNLLQTLYWGAFALLAG